MVKIIYSIYQDEGLHCVVDLHQHKRQFSMEKGIVFFLFICLISSLSLHAQEKKKRELQVSVFNNATALPLSGKLGIFHSPLHPGFSAGVSTHLNQHLRHQLWLSGKIAYLYQQRVQHGIQIYPELGYRFVFDNAIGVGPKLGIGYMHAFTDLQQFELNNQGEYERVKTRGTPSLMASFGLELGYDLQKKIHIPARLFTYYQLWFQTPFVRSYVPVLPNAALHLGCAFYLTKK